MNLFFVQNNIHKGGLKIKTDSGFTLIEALVLLFVFSVITLTFYSVFALGGRYIIESKNRLGAVALANERMEIVRNLQYDNIGIVGGIPNGNIPAEEEVFENNHNYNVKTLVQYVDDSFDGVSPADINSADYKRVKITVSWGGAQESESNVFLIGRFVPPGIEKALSGGTLSINIIGSDGIGVPQAKVHITNNEVSPSINMTVNTDDTGNVMLPGAKQSIQGYYMQVSRSGYETVNTIDPTSVMYSVTDTPASVVEGMLNVKSIIQDKISNIEIKTEDETGNPLPDVDFHLEGGRILGSDMLQSPAAPVFSLIGDEATDASGEEKFSGISPGQFNFSSIGASLTDHTLVKFEPFNGFDAVNKIYSLVIPPGSENEIKIKFVNNNTNSLLVNVSRLSDDQLLANAVVTLKNDTIGYDESITTLVDGKAFFPGSNMTLAADEYELRIVADGYVEYNETININEFVNKDVKLTAQ